MTVFGKKLAFDGDLHAELVKSLILATQKTLSIQCQSTCKSHKAFVLESSADIGSDLIATIDLKGMSFRGTIALCLSKSVYLNLFNRMFQENHTSLTAEHADGAGELLNMIFGQVKTQLTDHGIKVEMAIPKNYHGMGVAEVLLQKPVWAVLFETEGGTFHILLAQNSASISTRISG